ncbi:hypothetical protein B0H21DRAFT_63886 [Amylocystis lapponica]|nr:hypothetical protein B0H21DRAFT_63886 [Amylocystis lapponica]
MRARPTYNLRETHRHHRSCRHQYKRRGRTGTPSQGGFRFPSGENPQTANAPGPSSSGIGKKRSADAMRGQSAAPVRRPGQDISMANSTPAGSVPVGGAGWPVPQLNAAKREPLSALEVGEGGDVKRVRR